MEARIQAAFGALGGRDVAVPAWSLAAAAHTVCVPAPEFSDEEDANAADGEEAEAWVQVCEERGDALPTAAFCRALEREAEYDESDQLATGEGEPPPPLCTAVTVEEEEEEEEKEEAVRAEEHTLRHRSGYTLYLLDEELSVPGSGKRRREAGEDEPPRATRRCGANEARRAVLGTDR